MAVARIYQGGKWVPVDQGSPEMVSHDYLEYELSMKADFDHKHARPNWSAATTVALASSTDWVAPGDGFVLLRSCAYSTAGAVEDLAVATIGGVTVLRAYAGLIQPNTAYVYSVTGAYPVKTGDIIRFTHSFTVNSQTVTFVPE